MAGLSRVTVEQAEFSVRTFSSLARHFGDAIVNTTLADLEKLSDFDLARIVGHRGVRDVRQAIAAAKTWPEPRPAPTTAGEIRDRYGLDIFTAKKIARREELLAMVDGGDLAGALRGLIEDGYPARPTRHAVTGDPVL